MLNPEEDGIAQITDALSRLTDVSAIHLVSHGEDGDIRLGTSGLSQKTIDCYAAELLMWQHSLSADVDLLIYGCDLAASDAGIQLTASLNTLLGTDLAACDDDTGHVQFGGGWLLEHAVVEIQTSVAFTAKLQANWEGKLATITVDTFVDVIDGGDGVTSL